MRRSVLLALVLATFTWARASAAGAAPIALLSEDIDGDGKLDSAELDATGTLRVTGTTRTEVRATTPDGQPLTTATRLRAGRPQNVPTIVAELATATAREAVIFQLRGTWRVMARSPIGGVGLDEEYGYAIDMNGAAVLRYQTRPDLRRCDGVTAYLFTETLEPGGFERMPRGPAIVPATAPMLTARVDPASPPPAPPLIFRARAASTQAGAADAGALEAPTELDDGKLDTSWRESLPQSDGTGEFFSFAGVGEAKPAQLRIVAGRRATTAAKQANRPRSLYITTARSQWQVALPDPIAGTGPGEVAYVVDLPALGPDPCVTVILGSTYGAPSGETAIAELGIYAEGERAGGAEPLLAALIARGGSGEQSAAGKLAHRGADAVTALQGELAKTSDAGARSRLLTALARVEDPGAAPVLVAAVQAGWVGDALLQDIVRALAKRGEVASLQALVTSKRLTTELRIAAVSGIVPTGAGFEALVAFAGRGPAALRRAVIEQLRLAAMAPLLAAAAAQTRPTAAGDLYRAATRRAHAHGADAPALVTAMLAALPAAADYEQRYRLIDGLAEHGDAAALQAVAAFLRALPDDAETTALRQVAVRALAQAPRAEAAPFVVDAMADRDPGVRLAALAVLASADAATTDTPGFWHGSDGPAPIDRVIQNALADRWPEVRRRAAAALGLRCTRTGPATSLADSVAHDDSLDVRREALSALVQCRATGVAALLATTWDNEGLPTGLRAHAVALAIALGDPALGTALVAHFTRWRGAAIESTGALALAQSAAAAIGRLAPPGAADVLTAALDDTAFPEIVTSAALALGALGPACPPAARAKLTALSRSEPRAAAAALHAASQCGRAP